jgi:hypothetical protein
MTEVLERADFTAWILDSCGDVPMSPGRSGLPGIKVR